MTDALCARLLTIADDEATFARRQFCCPDPRARAHLETIGKAFLLGYRAALEERHADALGDRLDATPPEMRGFAFEGAGMAAALLDSLLPWRRRFRTLLAGRGRAHRYMLHVGAGWACARLYRRPAPWVEDDPLLGWLAVDGFGFHQGYFRADKYVTAGQPPRRARGYAARAFDQGLGRSLWFFCGAEPRRAARAIARLSQERHADLWSGLGLAATYAGGASRHDARHAAARRGPVPPRGRAGRRVCRRGTARSAQPDGRHQDRLPALLRMRASCGGLRRRHVRANELTGDDGPRMAAVPRSGGNRSAQFSAAWDRSLRCGLRDDRLDWPTRETWRSLY